MKGLLKAPVRNEKKCTESPTIDFLVYFFGGLECFCHSFAYVVHFVFLRDVWFRTQRAAVASRRAINLATYHPELSHPSPGT